MIIEAVNLSKEYFNRLFDISGKKSTKALTKVNLTLEKGRIIGLLGPNGSGKTTFIKILAGILKPTEGEIKIDGKIIGKETKAIVSYLPDINQLGYFKKISEAAKWYSILFNDFDVKKFYSILENLKVDKDKNIKELSKGGIEKLQLALALSRNAKLYIFDEPLAGVDPAAREKIINTIIKNYSGESTVIISTHLVSDVEKIFDDVVFIKSGEVLLSGNAEDLRIEYKKSINDLFKEKFGDGE